jgi:iron complex transport system permease protein
LAGVIMSFFLSSCVLLIVTLIDSQKMHQIILWLMGDLSFVNDANLKFFLILVPLGIIVLQFFGRDLDILALGEEKALHLGLKPEQLKRILFVVCSFIVAACVSNCGLIGFVGLVVPHLFRFFGGSVHRYLIPASSLGGALFLLLSDTLARTVIAPMEFPVGVITGFIGGLFFLVYFLRPIKR